MREDVAALLVGRYHRGAKKPLLRSCLPDLLDVLYKYKGLLHSQESVRAAVSGEVISAWASGKNACIGSRRLAVPVFRHTFLPSSSRICESKPKWNRSCCSKALELVSSFAAAAR